MQTDQQTDKMKEQRSDYSAFSRDVHTLEDIAIADQPIRKVANEATEGDRHFELLSLFGVVFKKLHPLFSIDCGTLVLYNKQLSKIIKSYTSVCSSAEGHITLETNNHPVSLSKVTAAIATFDFPILKSCENWVDESGENHYPHSGGKEYLFHCYIPLELNNEILGTLTLHNQQKELSAEGLTFCCNIADLFAALLHTCTDQPQKKALPVLASFAKDYNLLSSLSRVKKQLQELSAYRQQAEENKLYVPEENTASNTYPEIIGNSVAMQQVFKLLTNVSGSETTVLILGETGTGKELIAKAIHQDSERRNKQMIKVNCAAIPPNLIESELFGHEKGSFTGATERRIGKFELANNSTLFLDEIGELSLDLQVKLLRVLQEKEIERVGGKTTIPTDVRIVSATNRNLQAEVEAGRFRSDLFYRLNVFPIVLPALRQRKDDIPLLATHFLGHFVAKSKKKIDGFSQRALNEMMKYSWPGNIRELEHLVERQVLLSRGNLIKELEIPAEKKTMLIAGEGEAPVKTIEENERDHIFAVLQLCNGKISGKDGAAKLLGVPATTLNSKIKRLGLAKRHVI